MTRQIPRPAHGSQTPVRSGARQQHRPAHPVPAAPPSWEDLLGRR
ncbi:hypothetical protein [Vulcanococcus limneticus]|nr:hypothetical protein [Vulcanococcus limneticus]